MGKRFSATYVVETDNPGFSIVFTDSNEFDTMEEAAAFGEHIYRDAFVGVEQVSGDEPF